MMYKDMKQKKSLIICFLVTFVIIILFFPAFAALGGDEAITIDGTGLPKSAAKAGLSTDKGITDIIGVIINAILGILGTIFLLLVIIAGIRWMTAAGNEEQVSKSKSMIVAAFLGLAVVFLSYAFAKFVGQILAGI